MKARDERWTSWSFSGEGFSVRGRENPAFSERALQHHEAASAADIHAVVAIHETDGVAVVALVAGVGERADHGPGFVDRVFRTDTDIGIAGIARAAGHRLCQLGAVMG